MMKIMSKLHLWVVIESFRKCKDIFDDVFLAFLLSFKSDLFNDDDELMIMNDDDDLFDDDDDDYDDYSDKYW